MTKLSDHQSAAVVKLLHIGDPGAGKTGALASLVKAGYNMRIIDLDNGLDILRNLLLDDPTALSRVDFETLTDTFKSINGRLIPSKVTAWASLTKLLDNWPGLGPITSWTPQDILVIDSMTLAGLAALRSVLKMNVRVGAPWQSDFLEAQNMIQTMCEFLYADDVNCNVIVNSHVSFIGDKGAEKGYATTIGRALSPKIGRYFNSILYTSSKIVGTSTTRLINTQPVGNIEVKNSNPLKISRTYPLATGLADFFREVKSDPSILKTSEAVKPMEK